MECSPEDSIGEIFPTLPFFIYKVTKFKLWRDYSILLIYIVTLQACHLWDVSTCLCYR